jgi:hypothetical protein
MGGKGSGGARTGAGRPPKDAREKALAGWAGKRGTKAEHDAAITRANQPLPVMSPPADLPADQRAVWLELAPHAAAQRTLTDDMALAFRDLCEAITLKRRMLATIEDDGLTYQRRTVKVEREDADVELRTEECEIKAHPLLTHHRGLMQRVEVGLLRFRLSPVGKEVVTDNSAAKDEWTEFDGPPQ